MAYDLATAKARLNITGATQDAALQACLDTALAIAEKYCDRQFMYAVDLASFYYPYQEGLQLTRFPLEQVTSVLGSNGNSYLNFKMNKPTGQVLFAGAVGSDQIDVTYAGGYKTLPADLEMALFTVFENLWYATPGWGAPAGGSGVSTTGSAIKSVAIPDVGTIQFDTSGSSGAASTSGSFGGGLIPASAASLLDLYRLEQC